LNSPIKSSNVQFGDSLIVGQARKGDLLLSPEEMREQEERKQELEFKRKIEQMLIDASNQGKSIIADARHRAQIIEEEAKKKAGEIIEKANQDAVSKAEEAEALKQQAVENGYAEGLQKGYDDGVAQAKQEIKEKVWSIDAFFPSVFRVKKEIVNSAEMEILQLSTLIAEKVLRQKLEIDTELMREIVKSAIEQLKDKEEVKIIVNPALTQNLYEFSQDFQEAIKGLKNIKVVEDRTIPKDGVIVESAESRVDARIETQIKEITRNLMQEFFKGSVSGEIPEEIDAMIEKELSEQDGPE